MRLIPLRFSPKRAKKEGKDTRGSLVNKVSMIDGGEAPDRSGDVLLKRCADNAGFLRWVPRILKKKGLASYSFLPADYTRRISFPMVSQNITKGKKN